MSFGASLLKVKPSVITPATHTATIF